MQNLALIGTITLIYTLAVISPGPDFIIAVRNSLTYSRKTGIWTAVGFGAGISIHILYSFAGLAFLISKYILLFNTIKFIGAGYLVYIGIKSLRSKSSKINIEKQEKKEDISAKAAFKIGFLTNVLNPKATLFFLSLFTLAITQTTPLYVTGIISIILISETIVWFSLVAIFLTQEKIRTAFGKYQGLFNKTFGGLLIALGIKVALTKK